MKLTHFITFVLLLCFAGSASMAQCVNQTFIDYEGGTPGATPTTANLNASTHGAAGTWSISGNVAENSFQTYAQHSLLSPVNLCTGGLFDGSGTLGMITALPHTNATILFTPTVNNGSNASVGQWWYTTLPTNSACYVDFFGIMDTTHAQFVNGAIDAAALAGFYLRMEVQGGANNRITSFLHTTNVWYWETCQQGLTGGGTNSVATYSWDGLNQLTLQGEVDVASAYTNPPICVYLSGIGDSVTNSCFIARDSIKVDFQTAVFPLLPGAFPPTAKSVMGSLLKGEDQLEMGGWVQGTNYLGQQTLTWAGLY